MNDKGEAKDAAKAPRRSVRITANLIMIVLCLLVVEAGFTLYYYLSEGKLTDPQTREEAHNTFVAQMGSKTNARCRYMDTVYPHPYLTNVHVDNPPCENTKFELNNLGLFGRDFPYKKEGDAFRIMISGGSVAAMFGQLHKDRPKFLEEELNKCYAPPEGRKAFEVYNGADGGWKQPQQAIMTLLFGEVFDGIVTLEGFNEKDMLLEKWTSWSKRFEWPSNNFILVNPVASGSYFPLLGGAALNSFYSLYSSTPLLRSSNAIYFFVDAARAKLNESIVKNMASLHKSHLTIFSVPTAWSRNEVFEYNLDQYRKYFRMTSALAQAQGAKVVFFIQPSPVYGKTLTEAEKGVVGDLSYKDLYLSMTETLLKLKQEGIAVYSLLDVFSQVPDTVYADHIHFFADPETGESIGNRLVAKAIAARLAEEWRLNKTCND
ncbi:MAG: hypothetical protein AB7F41_04505 [Methylocystis sp.]|uniref:hypothetical protein n=1 Tax=Methylocystis sp. TaxID=1911079 RepID=UPI003D0DC272